MSGSFKNPLMCHLLPRSNICLYLYKSDWYWKNPKNKKYYKFRNFYRKQFIEYIDKNDILDNYNNIFNRKPGRKKIEKTDISTVEPLYYSTIVHFLSKKNSSTSIITSSPSRTLAEESFIIAGAYKTAVKKILQMTGITRYRKDL